MKSLWRAVRVLLGLLLRRPIVGICVIPVLPDGSIVMIRRRDTGLWCLPGGIMDWGEDITSTARRELREETGLTLTHLGRLVGVYSSPQRDARFHSVCITLEAHVVGHPQINDPVEVLAIDAVLPEAVLELSLDHDHAQHMRDYLANKTVIA